MPRRRSCGSSAVTSSASSCLLRPRGGRRHCPLSSVLECVVMSVRLDHGEDTLDEMHEINVTPFIDVMLVLLIIFMVAAPLATVDILVNRPASTADAQPRPDRPLYLTVKSDVWSGLGITAAAIVFSASAALYSLGHGGNDAQKTMGIIAVLLYSQGLLGETFYIPFWVILTCQAAMGLGTLVGGWRIVRTMGSRITRLHPVQGFCAEAGGAMTLFLVTYFGIPVSTTHTITGAIVGVGAARKTAAVRWNVASDVVLAWIVTLPAAALWGAAFYELYKFLS